MAGRASAGVLTSRDNKWLKQFRMALRGGIPTESGFVGVEGVRLVEEALRSGCRIDGGAFQRERRKIPGEAGAVYWAAGNCVSGFADDGPAI